MGSKKTGRGVDYFLDSSERDPYEQQDEERMDPDSNGFTDSCTFDPSIISPLSGKSRGGTLEDFEETWPYDNDFLSFLDESLYIDQDLYEKLFAQDWESVIIKLEAYAILKVSRLAWKTRNNRLPQGKQCCDLVYEAITKVFTGERKWDYYKEPDLLKHLMSVIDSLVSNLVRSSEHRCYFQGTDFAEPDLVLESVTSPMNPMANHDEDIATRQMLEKIRECTEGDGELKLIYSCLVDGMKPREIAEEYGMERERVYQLIRKLHRRVKSAEFNH